ncbi:MAG: hypothetical protein DMG24_09415, partial [Acidobacteria bacterium]
MSDSLHKQELFRTTLTVAALLGSASAVIWLAANSSRTVEAQAAGSSSSYTEQVEPILRQKCATCHRSSIKAGGLLMESYQTLIQGGTHGPVIVPGHSSESRLVLMLEGKIQPRMPFGLDPLPPAEIATIKAWIDAGAT